ncbi:DegT/DnrJ/EryC1/StrS family aminotransferase [Salmonella enterica subsp. enterica]|nr:DegT/DnrJ/EryC1/StrS family aminotransferase [Salmonella enterica]EHL9887074.1 DegT/DnrJ/EryC1/StrS family aminotransferase [Salmonella enterica subsp. salamae serovar 58:l,z13,z28:z6]QRR40836.1 DegT/DnrJ/EryC1/StrS family aminotransferase [Salmonella enterica subsp. enterica]HCM1866935.1 DegT/DnrJ/EryC1/StrS family aminotransferase [Salmonella enterica subsp. salamae serovar 58:a:z6]HCM1897644.1 DegT/DnrJ/EryC1/StrS family aminotransferase [Salmonella enterica subsp. salamae serovar 58:c:z6
MLDDKILVTQPFLPELNEFIPYLEKIWENKWLTNNGPFHQQLEKELCRYLGVEYVSLFNNATVALITAVQSLELTGEVITTPYSFVATTHSLMWNNLTPVFVDISRDTFNINPSEIEAAITEKTTAIMPVHCYGNPCDVVAIEKIAKKYNLKVIYDAAHAFGVDFNGESLLKFGDLSVVSFHATKVFNTFEGGVIICPNAETKLKIDQLKNFGFEDELTIKSTGINGKMSEVNAAFGLVQLNHVNEAISKRKEIHDLYGKLLGNVKGISIAKFDELATKNFSYYPILIEDDYGMSRDELYHLLQNHNIFSRRYFYPLISNMDLYKNMKSAGKKNLRIAHDVSNKVLCLPIYVELDLDTARYIARVIGNKE